MSLARKLARYPLRIPGRMKRDTKKGHWNPERERERVRVRVRVRWFWVLADYTLSCPTECRRGFWDWNPAPWSASRGKHRQATVPKMVWNLTLQFEATSPEIPAQAARVQYIMFISFHQCWWFLEGFFQVTSNLYQLIRDFQLIPTYINLNTKL